jgi:hypothetical protein
MRRNEVQGLAVPAVDIPKLGLTDADYRATKSLLFLPPAPEAKSDSSYHYYEYLISNHLRMCAAEDRRALKHGLYTAEAIAQRRETAELIRYARQLIG